MKLERASSISHFCLLSIFFMGFMISIRQAIAVEKNEPASGGVGPAYTYEIDVSNNPDVCNHMLRVFNTCFKNLWDAPPLGVDDVPNYSAAGKYAFPRLQGVEHDTRMTFDMRYSKLPSSKEFDAVTWKEGRITNGNPGVKQYSAPVLIGHFDINNDQKTDTVLKVGFMPGYDYLIGPKRNGHFLEYLIAWSDENVRLSDKSSLWELQNGGLASEWPTPINATYMRPFIYKQRSYLARYFMDGGDNGREFYTRPFHGKEIMSVLEFNFSKKHDQLTRKPEADLNLVCSYSMKQVK